MLIAVRKYHIGKSAINGKGIILDTDVKKDEIIFRFTGKVVRNPSMPWHYGRAWLQTGYAEWVVPARGAPGNYLNHSCNPNAGLRGRNTIVAMRTIKKGEEAAVDYALSETLPLWHIRCNCKAKNCRKLVKPYQDLPHQRQRKYVKYTAQYIKDMKMHLSWAEYLDSKKLTRHRVRQRAQSR